MKKATFLFFLMVIAILSLSNTQIDAKENNKDTKLIKEFKEDITGDGKKENIHLNGIPFSKDTEYYRDIWLDITSKNGKEWTINYEGGYEPSVIFINLNHDKVNDIFFQSATGGSGELYNIHLHTLNGGDKQEIALPRTNHVKGEFLNGFKASLTIEPETEPIIIDIKSHSKEYIRLGIYDQNGKRLKKTRLMIDPISFFKPIQISESKGYGLEGFERVSGAYHADQLGTIKTLWYLEKGEWINLKTKWDPA